MKILLDEDMPRVLKRNLPEHQALTVQDMGWAGVKNGELLKRADLQFDVFLTADQNLRYQQNVKRFGISIVVFPSNHREVVLGLTERLKQVLQTISRSDVIEL